MSHWPAEQCYQPFAIKSTSLVNYCEDVIHSSESLWGQHMGWKASPLSMTNILKEPVLAQVHERFPIANAGILTMPPHRSYFWHTDETRGVSINMLLTGEHTSHCLFGQRVDNQNIDFIELKYQPNTFYLFNTQWPHSVYNFDKHRFLFSIEFVQPKSELNYQQVSKWMKEQLLIQTPPTSTA